MLSAYCRIHASGYYLQWRQGRIDIGEGHDKNGQRLNCAVSANRKLKGWWNERKWLPWHAQTIPQRITMMGRVTLAPTRFMSRFMGSSTRIYGTLFDVSPEIPIIKEGRKFPLSDGQCC